MKYLFLLFIYSMASASLPPTTAKSSLDASDIVSFKYRFPNFTGTHTGTVFSLGINSVAGGGTGLGTLTANNVILGNGTSVPTFVAPGSSGNVLTSNGTTWVSQAPSGGSGSSGAMWKLTGTVVPFVDIDGTHYQTSTQSLTAINISMFDSGISGSTTVRVNQYRSGSLLNSATASLSASSGNPAGASASLSGTLSLLAGDIMSVDVVSTAVGTPYDLVVEY